MAAKTKHAFDGIDGVARAQVYMVPPEALTIIGLDTEDGPEHPRYDRRAKLPVSPALQASIARGWYGSVAAVKSGDTYQLVFGRQRVKAARAHNAALIAAGRPPIRVKVEVAKPGDEHLLSDMTISENECRQDDDQMTKALKLRDYLKGDKLGPRTMEEACVAFGCSEATLRVRLTLLAMAPEAQEAVAKGEMAIHDAIRLKSLPADAQAQAVAVKVAAKAKGERAPRVAGEGPSPSTKPAKREIMAIARELGGNAQLILMWSTGDIPEGACTEVKELADAFAAARKARTIK